MRRANRIDLGDALVRILNEDGETRGTGLFLDKRKGLIITCSHVIIDKKLQKEQEIELPQEVIFRFFKEETNSSNIKSIVRKAKLINRWLPFSRGDIAVLEYSGKIPSNVKSYPIGSSDNINSQRNEFYTIGFPDVKTFTSMPSEGKIFPGKYKSSFGFEVKLISDESETIIPGFSGAPVLNLSTGNIIGIISWISSPHKGTGKLKKNVAVIPSELILQIIPGQYQLQTADLSLAPKTNIISKFPRVVESSIYGREYELKKLDSSLTKGNSPIQINGIGGIGKSSFLKLFLSKKYNDKEYSSILWVDYYDDIPSSFLTDRTLINNLGLDYLLEDLKNKKIVKKEAFAKIIAGLSKIDGNNLLIIDGANAKLIEYLDNLLISDNWRLLVSSREDIIGFEPLQLSFLENENGVDAFKFFSGLRDKAISEEFKKQIHRIVNILGGHPLAIEITAKSFLTANNTTLTKLLDLLEERGLYQDKITYIKTLYDKVKIDTYIQDCLNAAFSLVNLSKREVEVLSFFCIFPPQKIAISSIQKLVTESELGKDWEFIINILIKKGWIKEDKEEITSQNRTWKNYFFCHPVLQESLLNNIPIEESKLSRIIEEISSVYLNYKESILKFEYALTLEEFPIHLHRKFRAKPILFDLSIMLSRFCHYLIYLENYEHAKKYGEITLKIGSELLDQPDINVINLSRIFINLSYVYRDYKPSFAVEILRRALFILEKCPSEGIGESYYFLKVRALFECSSILIDIRNFEEAIEHIEEALKLESIQSKFESISEDIFFLYRNKLRAYLYSGVKKEVVFEVLNKAKIILNQNEIFLEDTERIELKIQDASLYASYGDFEHVIITLKSMDSVLESNTIDFISRLKFLDEISRIYLKLGFLDQAVSLCKKDFEGNTDHKIPDQILVDKYLNLAEYYVFDNNLPLVKYYYEKAMPIITDNWDFYGCEKKISLCLDEALILRFFKKYTLSYQKSKAAKELYVKEQDKVDPEIEIRIANSIALDLIKLNNEMRRKKLSNLYVQIEEYLHLNENREINRYSLYRLHDTLGLILAEQKKYSEAIAMHEKSLINLKSLFHSINPDHFYIRIVQNNLEKAKNNSNS